MKSCNVNMSANFLLIYFHKSFFLGNAQIVPLFFFSKAVDHLIVVIFYNCLDMQGVNVGGLFIILATMSCLAIRCVICLESVIMFMTKDMKCIAKWFCRLQKSKNMLEMERCNYGSRRVVKKWRGIDIWNCYLRCGMLELVESLYCSFVIQFAYICWESSAQSKFFYQSFLQCF